MQLFKMSKIMISCALIGAVVSVNTFAKDENFSVGFTTVPEITLAPKQAMDFGEGIGLASGGDCTMVVTSAARPGDVVMKMGTLAAGVLIDAASLGDLSSTNGGCIAEIGGGTYGLYEVTGVAGGSVKVTVNGVEAADSTDFSFVPSGCIVDHVAGASNDVCTDITPGLPQVVRIASAGDTVGNTGGVSPSPTKLLIAVGGKITTTKLHTAGDLMTESFEIEVTY